MRVDDDEEEDMRDVLTISDYARYPFLKRAREFARKMPILNKPIIEMLASQEGKSILDMARVRINLAIDGTSSGKPPHLRDEYKLASFYLARRFLTCARVGPTSLIDKFLDHEASKCIESLKTERYEKKTQILGELGIDIKRKEIPVVEYIPSTLRLSQRDPLWKLVNRDVSAGMVRVTYEELTVDILKERIKTIMSEGLFDDDGKIIRPPKDIVTIVSPIIDTILTGYYSRASPHDELGEATPTSYPPCIEAILRQLDQGNNLSHGARFAIVTFLTAAGMKEEEIIEMFRKVRDFDLAKTKYQVQHITGAFGGTKYSAPMCSTMRSWDLCEAGTNPLCAKVQHPLGYYSAKQKRRMKEQPRKEET